MKKIITCLFAFIVMNSAFGQGHFEKGDNVISAGIGIGSSLGVIGSYGYSQSVGLNANFEHGIWEIGGPGVISLGGYLGYKSYDYSYFNTSYTIIGIRAAYHYNGIPSDKFDVYGGLMISYNIYSHSSYSYFSDYGSSAISSTGFIGGRYYFSPNIACYGELGYGVSLLNIGLSFKF